MNFVLSIIYIFVIKDESKTMTRQKAETCERKIEIYFRESDYMINDLKLSVI